MAIEVIAGSKLFGLTASRLRDLLVAVLAVRAQGRHWRRVLEVELTRTSPREDIRDDEGNGVSIG
jgi:hypothetical protein